MTQIWARHALLPDGWKQHVCIELDPSGRIAAVELESPVTGYRVGVLLPAVSNLHSHCFQRAMSGLTERRGPTATDSFWTWRQLMFRFLEQLTPDHVETIAAFVQMEMLEAGYANNTEFHYLHHRANGQPYDAIAEMSQRIIAAAQQTGIGLTLLPVLYQYGGCRQQPLGAGQCRFGNNLERFVRLYEQAKQALQTLPEDSRIGVAPHSLRAVAPESLSNLVSLADGDPIHMHLAEQTAEVEEVSAVLGQRPVEWLLDHAQISPQWCLIHCTQMQEHETMALASTGAVAGLCPITESNLGDGIFDGVRFLDAGGRIGIGSDSNIRISLTEELRMLEYSQRLRDRTRAALASPERSTGRRLYEASASGGSQASGRDAGRIESGAWADLVALDDAAIHLAGKSGDAILDSFIFSGDDRLVCDVWSAGRHIVHQGRHFDHDRITEGYRKTIEQLRNRI